MVLYYILVPLAWLVWHIGFRIRVEGRENLKKVQTKDVYKRQLQGASSPASSSAQPAAAPSMPGRVLNAFSGDELVYNKTLGDWRTHNGVDYACTQGAAVAAPVAGKVVSAGAEGNWGTVVVLEDAAGRLWRLCGVADPAVKAGDTVTAGQKLGTVGTVGCECAEESHIHVEVKQGEAYLDPAKLPE